MSIRSKIVVCGSFGYGNVGDEAVPLAIGDIATETGVPLDLAMVTRFDRPDNSSIVGMDSEDAERKKRLKGASVVFSGGGIIEPNPWSVLMRCQEFTKPSFAQVVSLFGCSVEAGVDYPWLRRYKIQRVLRRFNQLLVRDLLSYRMLKRLVPSLPVEVIGDVVLGMRASNQLPEEVKLMQPYVAVSLAPRWSQDHQWHQWLARELVDLSKELQASLVFVPCSVKRDDDRLEHRRIVEQIRDINDDVSCFEIDEDLEPRTAAAIFRDAKLTVGMRLHACVMSYAQMTPFVAIAYHPKIQGFAETIEWSGAVLPNSVPQNQACGVYGYKFESLDFQEGDLLRVAEKVIERGSFSKLDYYRDIQVQRLKHLLQLSV